MVKINKIKDRPIPLYSEQDGYIGEIETYLDFLDIRVQIKEKKLEGYFILLNDDEKIKINTNGTMKMFPNDIFGTAEELLTKLYN